MELSYQHIRDLIHQTLPNAIIVELYTDRLVYEEEHGRYFQVSYSVLDGKVTFGEKAEVEKKVEYVKVQAAMRLSGAENKASDAYGYKWRVRVVEFGIDKNGTHWTKEPLVAALPVFEGAKVFMLSEAQHQGKPHVFGKPPTEIVGWISAVTVDDKGIDADLNILKSANHLRDALVDSWERGNENLLGLSVDLTGAAEKRKEAGRSVNYLLAVKSLSVDVVYEPAAGGKFLRMAAALEAGQKEAETMEKMLAALKAKRPEAYKSIEAKVKDGTVTEDEVINLLAASGPGDGLEEKITAAVQKAVEKAKPGTDDKAAAQKILDDTKIVACGITLDRELASSGLPDIAVSRLRSRFEKQAFENATLTAAIKDEKEYLDKITGSGAVTDSGEVKFIRGSEEKVQAAMDKLCAVKVDSKFNDVPEFKSIRAAYAELTGDPEVRGYIDNPAKLSRLQAAFSTTTFSYALGNSLYRRMIQDYKEASDYGLSRLVSNKRNARDFRTLESIRVSYFGDLPDITPQTQDYPDLGVLTDERVDYVLNQKGGTITITRQMIINDDMSLVNKIVSRLPRASRRTKAKRGWNKFISNATYKGDNKAIYHADHGNLGSSAYAVASLVVAIKAMMDQTEPGSNEKLMNRAKTASISTALWDTVLKINRTQGDPGTANHGNPVWQFFGSDDSGIIVNPFQTDANDWMLFADPREVEILEIAYLNGQEEPEMFVANNPAVGQFFVADKIQYKIRDEYEVEVVDYRGTYKAVVA